MIDHNKSITLFINQLRKNPLFEPLGEINISYLGSQAKRITYPTGAIVFGEGDPSQGLYWLQSGTLKAVKYAATGREQILHLIQPGQTFNEVGAFTNLPNPASVVALEPVKIWHIPGEVIRQLIQQDPNFAQSIIDTLADRLRYSANLVEDLSLRPVTSRLSRLILDEAEGDSLNRPSWYTQNELAARLGTVADVIQRSLRKLETEGVIKTSRQQILITNRNKLEDLAA